MHPALDLTMKFGAHKNLHKKAILGEIRRKSIAKTDRSHSRFKITTKRRSKDWVETPDELLHEVPV
jgi:hypothetical protein